MRNQRVGVDPGSWDAFSDASTLNCRNRSCKDQREQINKIHQKIQTVTTQFKVAHHLKLCGFQVNITQGYSLFGC